MIQADKPLTSAETHPTQHAMLIVWGYFARTIGLLEQVSQVPIAQKTVIRPPQEKILEWLIGLLSAVGDRIPKRSEPRRCATGSRCRGSQSLALAGIGRCQWREPDVVRV